MLTITLGHLSRTFAPWLPTDGRIFDIFSYDTETTDRDDERPYLTPAYVFGAACDARRGVFISRENVPAFFAAHQDVPFICHNAAFDLKVTDVLLRPRLDIYQAVEHHLVWDTLILKRLHSLATVGHTARGECGLADCCKAHLGIGLSKLQTDAHGRVVRTNFGQFLGKPPKTIPSEYLTYLGHDVLATWHLCGELLRLIMAVLQNSPTVYGYVDQDWLNDAVLRFGPLTHHVQLKASILMDVLRTNGIGIDQARRTEKARKVQALLEEAKERLRKQGYLAGQEGCNKAMQSILSQLKRERPQLELKRTSGGKWSTAEEDLVELAAIEPFFADYANYKAAEKLRSTYLRKMDQPRLYPKFGYLLETGRTYCGGGFNLQNLPREKGETSPGSTIRGCFVPEQDHVFIDSDFSQIELVVLGYALEKQLHGDSVLAHLVNSGQDVHRLIAANLLGKDTAAVTRDERNSIKPISFGRPGGMGAEGLRQVAKHGYGIDLTMEEVDNRIGAYHQLCPELDEFLQDEVDGGQVIAKALQLTPVQYHRATGSTFDDRDWLGNQPASWLGGMLLKVLREEHPITQHGDGRAYTPAEIEFFWEKAQDLPQWLNLKPELAAQLRDKQPGMKLWEAVRNAAGRRPVFTLTGRLRSQTTFCSSRNTLFQGPAADGAILALWLVWRAGYKVIDFVHDQLVIESPADDHVGDRIADVEELMKRGMLLVVPGMTVKVETVVTRSLNKYDLDPSYGRGPLDMGGTTGASDEVLAEHEPVLHLVG
jgi:hypothetical protein